jgi:hypothetical protein
MNRSTKSGLVATTFAIVGLIWCSGCASTNVNPEVAKPGVGYVDFYCKDASVMWNVKDVTAGTSKRLFSKPKPVDTGVLRMAFAPGTYKLEVSFLNRVVSEPGDIELQIKDQQVLPVEAFMVPAGSTLIQEKSISGGSTVYGRPGRTTKVTNEAANLFRVELTPQTPLAYAKKELMSYAAKAQP